MSSDRETWVALSALQHLLFCERQAALIHVERQGGGGEIARDTQVRTAATV
ncbi:hypothetical protein [Corallococcus macrosporus]|uniref:CRISPR-associated Cas4 family protein n=1 Tax=Myxococcus fulvus (strain ATCC BAA-855 / HW-1) TaxID=483219 RepID=F8CQ49_MYXFH|nr:hypothetical protein [Corallococcus macrosporus]AEI64172.1 CRISPR-associated Cas4 family protein [Corallococcus macrosporus]